MIQRTIDIGGWRADIFFCRRHYNERVLEDALQRVNAPIGIISRAREIAREDEYNTGYTYSNKRTRESVAVIGKTTSSKEFANTFSHELYHLVCDICTADRVGLNSEEAAYLCGDITASLHDILGMFMCPHCNTKITKIKPNR